jgi:hypothetical protein
MSKRPSSEAQSKKLVALALQQYDFFHTQSGDVYGVGKDGPPIARFLRGGRLGLRAELANQYRLAHDGNVPSSSGMADAMLALEGHGMAEPTREAHLRVARTDEAIFVDIGDATGRAVRVDAGGWGIVSDYPVVFRRTSLTNPLPIPDPTGSVEELRALINVTDDSWPLLRAWMVAALYPSVPHPLAFLEGQQGSGKSTTGTIIAQLIDPSSAPLRSEPRDVESWHTAASGSWTVCLDNLSSMPNWLSDVLCKSATGDATVKRRLYTDGDLAVTSFRRCVILTSIDLGAIRGDLADRLAVIRLEPIAANTRRTDAGIQEAFKASSGRILGGILNLLSKTLALEPHLELRDLPRMADFGRIARAVDVATGTMPGGLEQYLSQRSSLAADVIESDPLASAIVQLMSEQDQWRGTAGALLEELEQQAGFSSGQRRPRAWPTSPKALGGRLRRLSPALSESGIEVEHDRDNTRTRQRIISIRKQAEG